MKFCYPDPPYLGCCAMYGHFHNDGGGRLLDGKCWNERTTHEDLVWWLLENYDGFALSLGSNHISLFAGILSAHPIRWGAWVKPFASFKPGVNPGYCWEPVIFCGGRQLGRDVDTVRDYVSANITLEKGTPGAKPPAFCNWVMDFLGYDSAQDTIDDLFPGSGAFTRARDARASALHGVGQLELVP